MEDVGKGMKGWSCCQAQGIEKPRDLHRVRCAPLLRQLRHPVMSMAMGYLRKALTGVL